MHIFLVCVCASWSSTTLLLSSSSCSWRLHFRPLCSWEWQTCLYPLTAGNRGWLCLPTMYTPLTPHTWCSLLSTARGNARWLDCTVKAYTITHMQGWNHIRGSSRQFLDPCLLCGYHEQGQLTCLYITMLEDRGWCTGMFGYLQNDDLISTDLQGAVCCFAQWANTQRLGRILGTEIWRTEVCWASCSVC